MLRNWHQADAQYSGEHEGFMSNVKKWIESGITTAELCFIWEEDSVPSRDDSTMLSGEASIVKGGVVYVLDAKDTAVILDFAFSADSLDLGECLLNQSMAKLRAQRATYNLYNDSEMFERYKQCFIGAGFIIAQEKLSYELRRSCETGLEPGLGSEPVSELETVSEPGTTPAHVSVPECTSETVPCLPGEFPGELPDDLPATRADALDYRSLSDVGEDAFIRAVALVTRDTLDSMDARSVAQHGLQETAKTLINELKDIEYQPDIWMLAYSGGELVGLVVPTNFGGGYGAINYIGVVPDHRGHGYVDVLLNKGAQLLFEQGVATIIADIDIGNTTMKFALERSGYVFRNEEVILEKTAPQEANSQQC